MSCAGACCAHTGSNSYVRPPHEKPMLLAAQQKDVSGGSEMVPVRTGLAWTTLGKLP